jgi:hypothetical protein
MSSVRFNTNSIVIDEETFAWDTIRSISLRTTSAGPSTPDQFLVVGTDSGDSKTVSLEWENAGSLLGLLAELDTARSPDWLFGSWTQDREFEIWPPTDDGGADLPARILEAIQAIESRKDSPGPMLSDPKEFVENLVDTLLRQQRIRMLKIFAAFGLVIAISFVALVLLKYS